MCKIILNSESHQAALVESKGKKMDLKIMIIIHPPIIIAVQEIWLKKSVFGCIFWTSPALSVLVTNSFQECQYVYFLHFLNREL